jgi:hypothetical protein
MGKETNAAQQARKLMDDFNLTAGMLAQKANLSASTIGKIVNGHHVHPRSLAKLSVYKARAYAMREKQKLSNRGPEGKTKEVTTARAPDVVATNGKLVINIPAGVETVFEANIADGSWELQNSGIYLNASQSLSNIPKTKK